MATIVTRSGKGSPLTNNEVDANFTNLNTDKAELSGATFTGEIVANAGIALGDNDKAVFGAGSDLQIYHDGSNSYIKDAGSGFLVVNTGATGFLVQNGSGQNVIQTGGNDVTLRYGASTKLATTSTGIDVTGTISFGDSHTIGNDGFDNLTITSSTSENIVLKPSGATYIEHAGSTKFVTTSTGIDVTGEITADGLALGDSQKATFGASNDLQIYHDGSHSYISDAGQGDLRISGSSLVDIKCGADIMFRATEGGSTQIRYDGSQKLATTATGIDVTGTATMDGLTVTDASSSLLSLMEDGSSGADVEYEGSSNNFAISTGTGGSGNQTRRLAIQRDSGDISFYEDTGTTPKLTWDASAELLTTTGLDVTGTATMDGLTVDGSTTTPFTINVSSLVNGANNTKLGLLSANNSMQLYTGPLDALSFATDPNDGGGADKRLNIAANGDISFYEDTGTTPKMVWDASAESLGIGTASPDGDLDVRGAGLADLIVRATSANSTSRLLMRNDAQSFALRINGDDKFRIKDETADADRLVVDTSGRVGIGTSSPQTVHGGTSVDGETSAGFEYIAGKTTTTTSVGQFLGGFAIRNSDSNASPDHYSGIIGRTGDTFGSANLEFYSGRDRYEAGTAPNMIILGNTGTTDGNVGIGTSSPNRVLHVEGTASTFGSTRSVLQIADDTAMAAGVGGGLTFTGKATTGQGDSNTAFAAIHGLKENGTSTNTAGAMLFSTRTSGSSPAERMRIDSSGNLLVGKTSATATDLGCQIEPDGQIKTTSDQQSALTLNRKTNDGAIAVFQKDGTTVGSIGNATGTLVVGSTDGSGSYLRFGSNNINPATDAGALRDAAIDLGKTGGRFKDLYLSNKVYADYIGAGGDTDTYMRFAGSNQILWATGGSESARIDTSGNLLVGTTSVQGAGGVTLSGAGYVYSSRPSSVAIYADRTGSDGSIQEFRKDGTAVGSIGTVSGRPFFASTACGVRLGGSDLLPANASGVATNGAMKLGGASTRWSDLYLSGRAHAGNPTNTAGNLFLHIDGEADGVTTGYKIRSGVGVTTTSSHVAFVNPNGIAGTISTSGSATTYNTSSDQRLKENIADADDAGSKIDAIQVRKYDWKVDGSHQDYGMIAQELLEVAPEAVSVPEDSEEMMGVDYSKLVPMLIKEIQSLRNRVAQLEE